MKKSTTVSLLAAATLASACKVQVEVPEGGSVVSEAGLNCAATQTCVVDIPGADVEEIFTAVPADGFQFDGWKRRTGGLCSGANAFDKPCRVTTFGFSDFPEVIALIESDLTVFLEPQFSPFDISGVGALLETNADIAFAAYSDSLDTAIALQEAIDAFAADPTQENLDAAKAAWLVAREPYGQTEVYRFRLSPIDSTNYMDEDGPEGDINAWPLGEALIDYVTNSGPDFGDDQVGVLVNGVGINDNGAVDGTENPAINIIADTSITIDLDLISNTVTDEQDERDVIAGYHAIEFLLWGQDLNDNAMVTDGTDREQAVKTAGASNLAAGGQRPLTDFTTDPGAARRLTYLQVAVEKLIDDLEQVLDGWRDGVDGNYRDQFTNFETREEAIQRVTEILTGMGTLSEGELAGERMQIAYSSNSQEDEHSCFADNTHRDILLNALGIENSYYGTYAGYDSDLDGVVDETSRAVDGFGFDDLAEELDIAALNEVVAQLETRLADTATNAADIDAAARAGSPFDVQIQDANRMQGDAVFDTIISLNQQSSSIAALAERLAIDVDVVDDDASECDTSNPGETCG